jgi:hypothetical protein
LAQVGSSEVGIAEVGDGGIEVVKVCVEIEVAKVGPAEVWFDSWMLYSPLIPNSYSSM